MASSSSRDLPLKEVARESRGASQIQQIEFSLLVQRLEIGDISLILGNQDHVLVGYHVDFGNEDIGAVLLKIFESLFSIHTKLAPQRVPQNLPPDVHVALKENSVIVMTLEGGVSLIMSQPDFTTPPAWTKDISGHLHPFSRSRPVTLSDFRAMPPTPVLQDDLAKILASIFRGRERTSEASRPVLSRGKWASKKRGRFLLPRRRIGDRHATGNQEIISRDLERLCRPRRHTCYSTLPSRRRVFKRQPYDCGLRDRNDRERGTS